MTLTILFATRKKVKDSLMKNKNACFKLPMAYFDLMDLTNQSNCLTFRIKDIFKFKFI